MKSRTLRLRREALTVLSDEEMQVAGGASTACTTPVTRLGTLCYLCVLLTDAVC